MRDVRIAVVQMQARAGMTRKNLDKIEHFTQEAMQKKVDLICFPELCIHGYDMNKALSGAEPIEPIPGESALAVSEMARRAGMVVLAGMAEKAGRGNPFLTQLVAFPDGTLQKYRKTHLGRYEQPYFAAGDEFPLFITDQARFGIQICWESHFPEVTTILSLKGGEIIFAPHASPSAATDRRDLWIKYLCARAYDNTVFVAACNLFGDNGASQDFGGGAMVIDPKGNILAEAFNGKEEMLVVDLDSRLINTIRCQEGRSMRDTFYLRARRPELYADLITKE